MALFGSNKADNSTNANDHSLTQATDSIGTSVKGGQGATAQDDAVSQAGGHHNTVDQSVSLADNTGSVGAFKGNNNSIAITTTSTDHGAVGAAFDFGNNALESNTIIAGTSLQLADRVAQTALAQQKASDEAATLTTRQAIAANESVSSDAISGMKDMASDAFDFGNAALLNNRLASQSALAFGSDALDAVLDANDTANARAFQFAGGIAYDAMDKVENATQSAQSYMSDALDNYHVATLQSMNNARQQSENANALIDSTLGKFAQNQTPALAENKTLLIGGIALLGAVILGSLASVAMATRRAAAASSRPEPRNVTPPEHRPAPTVRRKKSKK